jgi:NTP pyrophosphatase (non-canonical NTP hydrolase)
VAEKTKLILAQVGNERARQDAKWKEQNHRDSVWLTILSEEVGEAAKALLERGDLEEELIQIAAVAVAWHESIWRGKKCECPLCKDK